MRRRTFIVGAAAFSASRSFAQGVVSDARALSGDRFISAGQEYALADITAPPLYTLRPEKPAYFDDARRALQDALAGPLTGREVMAPTRWGVLRVRAWAQGERESLQEMLLRKGAARAAPRTEDYEYIGRLLAIEDEARRARRGLWALADYRVHDAKDASGALGAYHLIEGAVFKAELHGARFYLNFGEDFLSDFTASAASRLYRRWKAAGTDLEMLRGAPVRVRGLVEEINGPSIELKHPMQIERLG